MASYSAPATVNNSCYHTHTEGHISICRHWCTWVEGLELGKCVVLRDAKVRLKTRHLFSKVFCKTSKSPPLVCDGSLMDWIWWWWWWVTSKVGHLHWKLQNHQDGPLNKHSTRSWHVLSTPALTCKDKFHSYSYEWHVVTLYRKRFELKGQVASNHMPAQATICATG